MAELTASGPISLRWYNLQVLIANSPTWQTWTDSANASEAMEHIHFCLPREVIEAGLEQDDEKRWTLTQRPFCLLYWGDQVEVDIVAVHGYTVSCDLWALFEADVPDDYADQTNAGDIRNAMIWYTNKIGAVVTEVCNLAARGELLPLESARVTRIRRANPLLDGARLGDFVNCIVEFETP